MIQNFAKIDDQLWRGARPDLAGATWLVSQGVQTVINLEWEQGDDEAFAGLPPTLVRLADFEPLPWILPSVSDGNVRQFLRYMRDGGFKKPVFVHCRSGQNRTGVMVAAYRIVILNDELDTVLADFQSYKGIWAILDSRYIRTLYERKALF